MLRLVFVSTLFLIFSFIAKPQNAVAIANNNQSIPGFITGSSINGGASIFDPMEGRGNHCPRPGATPDYWNYAQYSWLSPAGAPKTTTITPSITISDTTDRVDLWVNYLSMVCNENINGTVNNNYPYYQGNIIAKDKDVSRYRVLSGSTSTTYGTLHGLDGAGVDMDYDAAYNNEQRYIVNNNWPFYTPYHNSFYIDGLAGLSVGDHTITIKADVRVIHKKRPGVSGFNFTCVNPSDLYKLVHGPNSIQEAGNLDDSACGFSTVTLQLNLKVLPLQDVSPEGNASVTCYALNVSGAEDPNSRGTAVQYDVYYDNAASTYIGGGTADATTNAGTFNLAGRGIPFGSKLKVGFYNYRNDGVADNNVAGAPPHWVTGIDFSPGPNCPNYVIDHTLTVTPDDEEDPQTVEFTGTFSAKNNDNLAPIKVNDVDITCKYSFVPYGGAAQLLATDTAPDANITNAPPPICEHTYTIPSPVTAGDQFCIATSYTPKTGRVDTTTGARLITAPETSQPEDVTCKPIVNKPYTKVFGGDVRAGVGFGAGACTQTANVKGFKGRVDNSSAAQLAIFASGEIGKGADNQFASAFSANPTKGLSFANTAATLGGFSYSNCLPDYFGEAASLAPVADNATISIGNAAADSEYKTNGDYTVSSPINMASGTRQTIYVDGNLIIKEKITYGGYGTIAGIPSLRFVVRGNIYIDKGVEELAGWFIAQPNLPTADGTIYTCANGTVPVADANLWTDCRTKLTVQGAFTANRVRLLRVIDSLRDAALNESPGSRAAEEFVFTPEQWLVAPPRYDAPPISSPFAPAFFITTLPPVL